MPDAYTMGSWKPFSGQEEAFIEAWTEFASWATGFPVLEWRAPRT